MWCRPRPTGVARGPRHRPPARHFDDATRSGKRVLKAKTTVAEFANGIIVLRYAADLFGEELVLISSDFKSHINQLRAHPSE